MLFLEYLRMMWRYSPKRTTLVFVMLLLSSITQGIGLVLLVPIVDALQNTDTAPDSLVASLLGGIAWLGIPRTLPWLLAAFLAVNLLRAIIVYAHSIISERFRLELLDDLRGQAFDAMISASLPWHAARRKSDMSNLLMNEIGRLGSALLQSATLVVSLFSLAAYAAVALALSFWLTLLALGLGAAISIALWRQHRLARELGHALSRAQRANQRTVEEGLAGIKLIKILSAEGRHSRLMRNVRDSLRERSLHFLRLNAAMTLIFQVTAALAMVSLLYVGTSMLDLQLSIMLVLVVLFARMAPQIRQIQTQVNAIQHSAAALEGYREMVHQAQEASEGAQEASSQIPVAFRHQIRLHGVSFDYGENGATALRRVSVAIPHGKITAISGPSGSGKSTLADVVMGLLTPAVGTVLVDGVALDENTRFAWRKGIAYVPQDVFLFHDSIRNNLLLAKPEASDAELAAALNRAAAGFVMELPQGLDTIVGHLGHKLSGGERQRIALARGFLQDPQLLILDEPTSALDHVNEALIHQTIREMFDDLTVILISHRDTAMAIADHRIVLDNGSASEAGPLT